MVPLRVAAILGLATIAGAAHAGEPPYPWQPAPTYTLSAVDQFNPVRQSDILPMDAAARTAFARNVAIQAAIYGLPAVYEYREMFRQAVDRASPRYIGFDRFAHERNLAGPDYKAFKSPNSDTLYSNAWLDLTNGPVLIATPDVPLKYYTLNLLDMFSNASNISTRTFGSKGGRYLIVPANWSGDVPKGVTVFRVATPHVWVLMRVFAQNSAEIATARAIQDAVKITPLAGAPDKGEYPEPDAETAGGFFTVLDHILRTDGHPKQEDALVYAFRAIGIGGREPFDIKRLDPETRAGVEAGFREAMKIIQTSRSQLGVPTGTGWNKIVLANFTFNYLRRAAINYVGLGANVDEEDLAFNTFVDGQGRPLNGANGQYTFTLNPPPPVNAFWSVTLYDASTRQLYPNTINRYLINDRTPGLVVKKNGSITIQVQHDRPNDAENWLPAPSGPFYLVIRSYLPKPGLASGTWRPEPVAKIATTKGE